ncbi:hypothetical protein [Aulosira sp. FACHB-615]|uniref:hypothetical protein n=1 Tax=Aulosira sp. FACHB-615 TaxID=2692777 RepID=UPI001686391D|nr:hypothetical protein [Aulosira sp. FACHB-615]MBD2489039.1 hypothetical protein [Aulosira sp. FACHB-615]
MTWQHSQQNPPHWWQLHLGNGLLEITIKRNSQGYCASLGRGKPCREKIFPTLPEAKAWGIKEAKLVLRQMRCELYPVNWLLALCLLLLGFLGGIWLVYFNPALPSTIESVNSILQPVQWLILS